MNVVTRWVTFSLLFFFLMTSSLLAEVTEVVEVAKSANETEIMLATIRKKIEVTKNKANLEEALKQRILNAYIAAEDNLEERLLLQQQTEEIQNQIKDLPNEIKRLEKSIKKAEHQLKDQQQEALSRFQVNELEQRLIIEKSNLNQLKASINRLETQIADQLKRPQQIREQSAEVKNSQANAQQEQAALSGLVKNKQELNARKIQLDSHLSRLNATLTKLDLENIVYPLSMEEQKLELQLLNLQAEQLSALIKEIDDFLAVQRQQEIESAQARLIQAQKEAIDKHPFIQAITRENIRYNQLLQNTNRKIKRYIDQKNKLEDRYKQLEKDSQSAEQKINLAGLSPALGNLLREQRRHLPLTKGFASEFEEIRQETALTSLAQFQLDEEKKFLTNIDQALQLRMSAYALRDVDEAEQLKIQAELRVLLSNQKEFVLKLASVYSEYLRTLADVDYSLHHLVTLGEKFNRYLNERLLWVPSAPVIDKNYVQEILKSIDWLGNVSHWQQLAVDIEDSLQASLSLALLGFFMISLQLGYRRAIKARLDDTLIKASKPYTDRFGLTFHGLGYVFLLALPFPMLLALLGWLLFINEQVAIFSHLFADGLLAAAIPLLIIQFFYLLFKPAGLAQSLFGWQGHSILLLHGQLKWVRLVVVPALFLIGMFADERDAEHSYTLGRMALIIAMLTLCYLLHRFAHPVNGLGKDFYQENPGRWICRLRYIWYGILVLVPLMIIGFAIAGYYQSALELQLKLVILLRLIFFTVLLHEIVMRWLVLANRQLALQNARQKRKLQEKAEVKERTGAATINPEEELLLDIPKINEQSEKLLDTVIMVILLIGFWLTLRDIFPALSIFDQVVLWHQMALIDGQELLQPITLVNVFVCFLYLVLMLVFVKNFPGLIDLFLVGRYSMSSGSRYAFIHLASYAVITITFIAIANKLGGNWSQVQWLVAAISVGLGFGLQEIFANMVSGIILLFERPIRVGDTITVGDIHGKVSRIQIRATTIVDWDQKELIVPNKTFITDKLINWTLTDTVTRVVIPVGVAYDSDEELALNLLKQITEETPLVLKDPKPSVFFIGFGESSLDFSLRVFVRDMEDRLIVTDAIHRRIRRVFKEHHIEIPFPQRDLHIRSSVLSAGKI
ncbi:MAG: mechanosensitive ion channel [Nitrosomonas sp.]|nr:mechanosensitive ion channel [Nitrosomonas sp.]MDP1951284.1 mechanosensitive ion channel [Nitrosomonas sp.]